MSRKKDAADRITWMGLQLALDVGRLFQTAPPDTDVGRARAALGASFTLVALDAVKREVERLVKGGDAPAVGTIIHQEVRYGLAQDVVAAVVATSEEVRNIEMAAGVS